MPLEVGDRVVVLPSWGGRRPNLMKVPEVNVGDTALLLPIRGWSLPITIAFPTFDIGDSVIVIPELDLPKINLGLPTIVPPTYHWWRAIIVELSIYCSVTGGTYQVGNVDEWNYYLIGSTGFYYTFFDPDWIEAHPGEPEPIPDIKVVRGDVYGEVDLYFVYSGSTVAAGRDALFYKDAYLANNPAGVYGPPKYAVTLNLITEEIRVKT